MRANSFTIDFLFILIYFLLYFLLLTLIYVFSVVVKADFAVPEPNLIEVPYWALNLALISKTC